MKRAGADNRYYGKFFLAMTVSIVLTIAVLSVILYVHFERISLKQAYDGTMERLEQTTQEASVMSVTAATFAKQIYSDPHVANLLNFPDADAIEVSTAVKQLNNYRETSPFIDSIYVYNAKARAFYVSSDMSVPAVFAEAEFYDQEMADMATRLNEFETLMPIPRKLMIEGLAGNIAEKERDTYTFLLYDTLTRSGRKNVVVVNIKETQLHKLIDGSLTNDATNSFVIDADGKLVSSSWKYPMLSDMRTTPYIRRVLQAPEGSGYFAEQVDGVKSLVTYTEQDYLGWRYIRIVPYSQITAQITDMRNKTIVIAGSILLAGLALSYLVSRRLYAGISHKLTRLGRLEAENREALATRRAEWLKSLLKDGGDTDALRVKRNFERYGIPLEPQGGFRVVLLAIDDYGGFSEQYAARDRRLIRFGLQNIAQEIMLASGLSAVAVDMSEDHAACLIQEGQPGSMDDERLSVIWPEIQSSALAYLKLSVTLSVSEEGEGIAVVNALYDSALEASYYRLFEGYGAVIRAEDVEAKKAKTYDYPAGMEKQLIEELMLGRMSQVKQLFADIIDDATNYSYMSFQLAITRLSFALQNTLRAMNQHHAADGELAVPSLHLYTNDRVQSLEELKANYMTLFAAVGKRLEDRKRSRNDDLPDRIKALIESRYADPDLSLDMLSEELGLSATYLGRIFKQHTYQTILGYINEVRMNRVRTLLEETNDPVGEIAERAGFANNPYFYKAFKKYNGVTPAEYRKNSRQRQEEGEDSILA
ncbi:AraC family transcriptional regulator [Paenibacillus methanolicus]|uniref:AraC-like DNA-binding protein n=1 Tax=Paenibacillus methanolicus TaxID=582686 RepID=A0A5S5C3H5_9BACL|nr:AraC family transcriptional regulator [Paenibacillus methanolicus]TYP73971.1 AraC-like DNA-binding protein [Paenibacillus methanolicus]